MEFIRKLSNFNFQWTKTLYRNNLNNIVFIFIFFKGYRYNQLSVKTLKTISHGGPRKQMPIFTKIPEHSKCNMSFCSQALIRSFSLVLLQTTIVITSRPFEKSKKECDIVQIILVKGFCPLKTKITHFPDGFLLNT